MSKSSNKRSRNGKKCASRNDYDRRRKDDKTDDYKSSKTNDVSWYTRNPSIAFSAGNLSFNAPLGDNIELGSQWSQPVVTGSTYTLPGTMAIGFAPTGGGSHKNESILNDIANDQYAWVRYANSGHANYDPNDYMLYLLGVIQTYVIYGYLTRAYGVARTFSGLNRYYPSAWLEAMGLDPADISMHLADLRYYIEYFRSKMTQFYIPGNMPILQRAVFMSTQIYADAPLQKSQTYVFSPTHVFKYSPRSTEQGGSLEKFSFCTPGAKMHFDTLVSRCEEIIQALIDEEDIGIMSGDTLKAYGADKCAAPAVMPVDYVISPVYDLNILKQIENSLIFGTPTDNFIRQELTATSSYLVTGLTRNINASSSVNTNIAAYGPTMYKLLLAHTDVVDPSEVIESSRYLFSANFDFTDPGDPSTGVLTVDECDFFIITQVEVFKFTITDNGVRQLTYHVYDTSYTPSNSSRLADFLPFSVHPQTYWFNGTTGNLTFAGMYGDVENYAVIDNTTMGKLMKAAKLSQFDFPIRGV